MDKALNYLALARKGGRIEVGEEPCGGAARAGIARLIVVARDAADHTWRRAKSYAAGTNQQCVKLPYSKDELGQAVGRSSVAMAAITDAALAVAFLKALPETPLTAEALAALEETASRLRQRQTEAKAHAKNVRTGKARKK